MDNFWADRRIKTGHETAGELAKRYNRKNYRLHPETQQRAVEGSLDDVGIISPVSVSDITGKLFDGHLRVELALLRFGEDFRLPVDYYDLDEAETSKALLYRDLTAQMAEIDVPALQELRFELPEFDNPDFDEFLVTDFYIDFGDGRIVDDPMSEWKGMPEFEQEDNFGAVATIKVHFATVEDIKTFSDLVGQSLNEKSKFIWYPKQEKENLKQYQVIDE